MRKKPSARRLKAKKSLWTLLVLVLKLNNQSGHLQSTLHNDDLAIARQTDDELRLLGTAKAVFISEERQAITDLLKLYSKGLKPKDIAEMLSKKQSTVRKLLTSIAAEQQVNKDFYIHRSNTPVYIDYGSSKGKNVSNSGRSGNTIKSSSDVTNPWDEE